MKLYRLYNPFGFGVKKKKEGEEVKATPAEPTFKYAFRYPRLSGLRDRVTQILIKPEVWWPTFVKMGGAPPVREVLYDFVAPVAAMGALLWFVIECLVGALGISVFLHGIRFVASFIAMGVAGVYAAAMAVKMMLWRHFGRDISNEGSVALVAFSAVPYLLFAAFPAIPGIGVAPRLFAFYGLYIFYCGCQEILQGAETREMLVAVVTVGAVLLGFYLLLAGFVPVAVELS